MKKRVDSLNLVRIGLIFTIFVCHSSDFIPEVFGYYAGTLTGYAAGRLCFHDLWFLLPAFWMVQKRTSHHRLHEKALVEDISHALHRVCLDGIFSSSTDRGRANTKSINPISLRKP